MAAIAPTMMTIKLLGFRPSSGKVDGCHSSDSDDGQAARVPTKFCVCAIWIDRLSMNLNRTSYVDFTSR
ncbi:hypothetical protein HanHA300_Chr02g0067321 [Helianthus annuus]|nr:hypothetical protein HanHA300_Chr02g0067321 [Helianthus annuus]KAJ0619825.1 hypothetical protein HanHA89_Chr02g0075591 [Helianthus annuus]KAJ0778287.1 hypothetical protein HanLR1_Chr02g0070021 [Helianthus annuus]KAJ0787266.1 hypothetical protein HanOQP8_Chr02g0080571 [Helianthus annuus]